MDDIKSKHVKDTEEKRGMNPSFSQEIGEIFGEINQTTGRLGTPNFNTGSIGTVNIGQHFDKFTKYDKSISEDDLLYSGRSLEDLRAQRQSWQDQWANNFLNFGAITVTTMLDGWVGIPMGIINMIATPYDPTKEGNWLEQKGHAFVNNPASYALNSVQRWIKERTPTYLTDEYIKNREEGKWWKNWNTSQFWGEGLVETAGFTTGMALSGMGAGAMLNRALRVGNEMRILKKAIDSAIKNGKVKGTSEQVMKRVITGKENLSKLGLDNITQQAIKNINQKGIINKNISTAIAVSGEARQEGLNAANDYREESLAKLNSEEGYFELMQKTLTQMFDQVPSKFNNDPSNLTNIEDYQELLNSIKPEYVGEFNTKLSMNREYVKDALDTSAARITSMTAALNFPVLYASSLWQFGNTFAKNFSTQRGLLANTKALLKTQAPDLTLPGVHRLTKEGNKYIVKNNFKHIRKQIARYGSNVFAEYNEEMMQAAMEEAATRRAGLKMNSFLQYDFDPNVHKDMKLGLTGILNSVIDTYSDPAAHEEGFFGGIMGLTGSLNVSFSKNARGKRPLFQGGFWNEYLDSKIETAELKDYTERLNNFLESDGFKALYNGNTAHIALESMAEDAALDGDKFIYHNARHAQLIKNLAVFQKLGKLQDFYDRVESDIEMYSTNDVSEITELAEEARELTRDKETGKSPLDSVEEKDIVRKLKKNAENLKRDAQNYSEIVTNFVSLMGDQFLGEDEFNEMVYLYTQIDNFDNRYNELHTKLVESFGKLDLRELEGKKFKTIIKGEEKELSFKEILSQSSPSELYDFLQAEYQLNEDRIIRDILDTNESVFNAKEVISDPDAKEMDKFKATQLIVASLKGQKEREDIITSLNDLTKIHAARSTLVNLINKFTNQPHTLTEKLHKEVQEALEEQVRIENEDVIKQIKEAESIDDLRKIINEDLIDIDSERIENILHTMSLADNKDSYSPLVEEYRKIQQSTELLENQIDNLEKPDEIKDRLKKVLYSSVSKAESSEDILEGNLNETDITELLRNDDKSIVDEIIDEYNKLTNNIKEAETVFDNIEQEEQASQEVIDKETPASDVEEDEVPIVNDTIEDIEEINNKLQEAFQQREKKQERSNASKMWYPGVQQNSTEPHYATAKEFLDKNGAFDYINSGKLMAGDKVFIMPSQEYWDYLKERRDDPEWVDNNKPMLLVVRSPEGSLEHDGKKYQVIGVWSKALNGNLHKTILEEGFSEKYSTTIVNVTPGYVDYSGEKELGSVVGEVIYHEGVIGDKVPFSQEIIDKLIEQGIVEYLDEEGNPCVPNVGGSGKIKAEDGLTDTVKGTNWRVVKDFQGYPKHSQGGVDISISDKGVSMRRGNSDIKAKHGLLIAASGLAGNVFQDGGQMNTTDSKGYEDSFKKIQSINWEKIEDVDELNTQKFLELSGDITDRQRAIYEYREAQLEGKQRMENIHPGFLEVDSQIPEYDGTNRKAIIDAANEVAQLPKNRDFYVRGWTDLGFTQEEADKIIRDRAISGAERTEGTSDFIDAIGFRELNQPRSTKFIKSHIDHDNQGEYKIEYELGRNEQNELVKKILGIYLNTGNPNVLKNYKDIIERSNQYKQRNKTRNE